MDIKSIQMVLKSKGYYSGRIDGIAGPLTSAAVTDGLKSHMPDEAWRPWSRTRRQVAFMQAHFKSLDIETGVIDGYLGPQTLHAFEVWKHLMLTGKTPEIWRDDVKPGPEIPEDTPYLWPKYKDLTSFYGEPGTNQTKLDLPYPMKIAWDTIQGINRFTIHEKCADSAARVFERIAGHYSPSDIAKHGFDLFGGCYNKRKMRGGSRWSTHAWAIAIDFDPIRNQLRWGRDRAYLARSECNQFWEFWESEGWTSLGRARNFDHMHIQASDL